MNNQVRVVEHIPYIYVPLFLSYTLSLYTWVYVCVYLSAVVIHVC